MIKANKKLIIWIALFLLCGLFVFLDFYWQLPMIIEKSENILKTKNDYTDIQNRINNSANDKSIAAAMKGNRDKLAVMFANIEEPIEIIKTWEKIAQEFDLSIDMIPYNLESNKSSDWKTAGFQIKAKGADGQNILRFVEKIENSQYLSKVKRLSISVQEQASDSEEKSGQKLIFATIEITIFSK